MDFMTATKNRILRVEELKYRSKNDFNDFNSGSDVEDLYICISYLSRETREKKGMAASGEHAIRTRL